MNVSALDRQREIYLNGFSGILPKVNIDLTTLEKTAQEYISKKAFAYIAGGAGTEATVRRNREAFDAYKIIPRMLKNVGERDISINLFGTKLPSPFLLSPIGVLEMVDKEADLAVARAAAALSVPYIFSNQASVPMEGGGLWGEPSSFRYGYDKPHPLGWGIKGDRGGCVVSPT